MCEHLRRGLLRSFPAAQCRRRPLTDGSEGTLDAVLGGKLVRADVHDPLFHPLRTAS